MRKILQAFFVAGVILPITFLIMMSLGKHWIFPDIFPEQLTSYNWSVLFNADSELLNSFLISLTLSLSVATISTAAAFLVSRYIARSVHRNLLLLFAYIPYVLSPVILAATILYFFVITDLSGSIAGVLIAQFLIAFPFGVIICNNFWNDKIRILEEQSMTLGASSTVSFFRVLVPLARNVLLLCFFQTFLISWFEFGLTTLIGVGAVKTLPISVFAYINEAGIFFAALASCLLILPPMILIWVNKRFIFNTQNS